MSKTTAQTQVQTREELAQQIANQLMSSIRAPKASTSITDRLLQFGANTIADAGNGVAELMAGFEAASDNFAVHKEAARQRQAARTAAKVAALVEADLKSRGL